MTIVSLARDVTPWLIKRRVRQALVPMKALLLLATIPLGGCASIRIEIPHSFIETPRLELLIALRDVLHDHNSTEK